MASPPSSTETLGLGEERPPTVTLYNWWLVKSEDNDGKRRLAVAGVCSAPQEIPRRMFYSAPISKKHDVFTLETTDGVIIILDRCMNTQQTIASGFPDEIAKRFQLGFYTGWETAVAELLGQDSNTNVSSKISDSDSEGTVQSWGGISEAEGFLSNYSRRVRSFLLKLWSKWMNQHMFGDGLNSEKKTTDSVLTISKTVNNSLQIDECEVGEKGMESSCLTLHLSLEKYSHEQVSCEEMCDSEFPKQLSSRQSLNNAIDDMVNHAVEEETDAEDFVPTALQSIGLPKTLEENEKNLEYGCSIKLNSTSFSPSTDEGVGASGVTIPLAGEINISKTCSSNPGGRVSGNLSISTRSKGKTKKIVGSGLNSEQNTVDSVPAVESVGITLQSVDYEVGGRQMLESFLSCCQRAEELINSSPASVHFAHVTPSTAEVNNVKEASLSTRKANTRKRQVSASLAGSKKRKSTPSTLEVNKNEKVYLSTTKVNTKKRKVSPSKSEVSKKNKLIPSTLEGDSKKKASLSNPKVTAYTSIISPESLSAGRSRSGRLLLQPLEFWRNQSPVYDKDHGVIGIQEEVLGVTPSRGILSDPRKRKGNRG